MDTSSDSPTYQHRTSNVRKRKPPPGYPTNVHAQARVGAPPATLSREPYFGIYGRSPSVRGLIDQIKKAADSDVSVLACGETGVGKDVIARAIHSTSRRAQKPFEVVECAALTSTHIASELFGHEAGAFTGAGRARAGAFERANGGTLFLDEIGDLPESLQPVLLRVLNRRKFRRVGGTKAIELDVRIIAATHRDLKKRVANQSFEQGLYRRIAAIRLDVPPLRERSEDIPILLELFLRKLGLQGPVSQFVSDETLKQLSAHSWPGNVRELRNFVHGLVAMGVPPELDCEK